MVIHDHKRIKTWNVKSGCSVEHSLILWAVLGSATRFCPSNLPLSPPYMFFHFLQMTFMCSTCFDAGDPLHSLVRACDHGSEVAQTPSSFSIESSESIFRSSSSCSPDGLGSRLADFWWQGIFFPMCLAQPSASTCAELPVCKNGVADIEQLLQEW